MRVVLFATLLTAVTTIEGQTPQAATPPNQPEVVAGIAVNYDEAKAGTYTLPDPLMLNNGKPVLDAQTWWEKRRPEIVSLFEDQQYGRAPGRPPEERFAITEAGSPALGGKAIRRQVTISFSKDPGWPQLHVLMYLPANAKKPVPMLLNINFGAVSRALDDAGITVYDVWDPKTKKKIAPPAGPGFGHLEVEPFINAGFGVATFYYGDLDPDFPEGFSDGIRARYLKPGTTSRSPEDWGSVAAWAWGMSRVEDYFETDKQVDAQRVAIHGISRLGKTVMWAGAHDQRFAAVIASCSGEGGAALSHRNYGETIAHLTDPTRFSYQFALNYAHWAGFPDRAPVDANLLIALIAPRPLLLQTGSTDGWSDPKGEFLAESAAQPVYKLLGQNGLGTDVWPAANQEIGVDDQHSMAYFMHEGGHGMVASDWMIYVNFLKAHLHPER